MKLELLGYDIEQDCACSCDCHCEFAIDDTFAQILAAYLFSQRPMNRFDRLWVISADGVIGDYREGDDFQIAWNDES